MKTIVINTSKEAKKTKLDILFNAPFDHSCLIWYDREISKISEATCEIKQALITDTDTVDRDYNIIVLVDLYEFPRGNERDAVEFYKALMTQYVGVMLVDKLRKDFNLLPQGVSIYFAESSKHSTDLDLDKLDDNAYVQQKKQIEAYIAEKEREESVMEDDPEGDLVETIDIVTALPIKEKNPRERLLMELFSWSADIKKTDFEWKLKVSLSDDSYIDFFEVFKDVAISIEKSQENPNLLDLAVSHVLSTMEASNGSWDSVAEKDLPYISNYSVRSLTCRFERDNEQNLTEGFFNVYVNIFMCVQKRELLDTVAYYSSEQIKDLLINALKKYKYFSDEKNIPLKFEPISFIFENRSSVFKKHKKKALEKSVYKDTLPEKVAEEIMTSSNKQRSVSPAETTGMHDNDKAFYELVGKIFDNYDSEVIQYQNSLIIKNCLVNLWDWKNSNGNDDFRRIVDSVVKSEIESKKTEEEKTGDEALTRDAIEFITAEHEKEYSRLINDITDVEHHLSSNKNILNETKEIMVKYSDLMRKGKFYLVSFIGAITAVIASVLPYIYINVYALDKSSVSYAMCLLFTAGFAFLYALASGIYVLYIARKKALLKSELELLKAKSEQDRKERIIALYNYYSNTVVEANSHYLLWNEILRRDSENARKGIKRNAHISRFSKLVAEVERYLTMLKIDIKDIDCCSDFECENIELNSEEPFHSDNNRKVYSILPDSEKVQAQETEEGEE